jgi:hypothetical protein
VDDRRHLDGIRTGTEHAQHLHGAGSYRTRTTNGNDGNERERR